MTLSTDQAQWFSQTFDKMADNVEKAVLGKRHVVRLALTCMLAEGHLLLEDFPGTGKTQLAVRWRTLCRAPTPASSSRPTCCRPTSPA
jgi:MoxR-like ATPase